MKQPVLRLVLFGIAICVAILILLNLSLIGYGIAQLKGQLHIITASRPIEEFLEDPAFPDSLKHNLRRVNRIRQFAIDSLGLKENDQYKTLYDQKGKPVLWLVTASDKFRLKSHTWSFPFVGEVEYKGFFDKATANSEAEELRRSGFDVGLGTVGAWSTLGWFNDPLLSRMLERSEGAFAELLIHEISHGTVYIPNDTEASENLATFIGEEGAIRYLRSRYGANSPAEKAYREERQDEQRTGEFMLSCAGRLERLYAGFSTDMPSEEKQTQKQDLFKEFAASFDSLGLNYPESYARLRQRLAEANNTVILAYVRYRSGQNAFAQVLLDNGGDLRKLVDSLSLAHQ